MGSGGGGAPVNCGEKKLTRRQKGREKEGSESCGKAKHCNHKNKGIPKKRP